ncbi:MAG: SpoIIE family protein phosphatase [Lachnospiraceae bacterium]|nr:SpoIIE family protein phosphatase [Lachnospiraceae bacterium]
MYRKLPLGVKFIVGFVIIGILICLSITVIGYRNYSKRIQKQYNDTAYDIAETFESFMTEEELALYMDTAEGFFKGTVPQERIDELKGSERYREVERLLYALREATNANDIYMTYSDREEILAYDASDTENWHPSTYIFDCYMVEELKFDFGHMGGFNASYIEPVLEILETGERIDNYFVSEGEFGHNTSAVYPVIINGVVRGVIGVEIPMSTLESALQEYIVSSVMVTVLVAILFIIIFMMYTYRNMIGPIKLIAHEAENFVKNDTEVSDKLDTVNTGDEIQMLSQSILQMEIGIKEYIANLTEITAEKERIGAELNVAKQIQADMLPSIFPAFPERAEFDIFATMTPAREVGGDFYDFFMVDRDHLAVVIADVSGKGVPAALFMVIAKTLLKNHAQKGEEPSRVFEQTNDQLCENNKENMFVTAWMGILEISTGKLSYVNAGHNPPVIKGADGVFRYLEGAPDFVLAGMEGLPYQQSELMLHRGDSLYLYTDGVTEANNMQDELYGEERLEEVLNLHAQASPEEILKAVKESIDTFVGEAEQFDDITMLCLTFLGENGENREK